MNPVFSIPKRVNFYNCDMNGHLLLSSFLGWNGEIAGLHSDSQDASREALLQEQQVFLLAGISLRFLNPPTYRTECLLETWEAAQKGVQIHRAVTLTGTDGTPLCHALSSWILVNPKTRKILRLSEYHHQIHLHQAPLSVAFQKPRPAEAPCAAVFQIPYHMLDHNRHLSNRFYGDLLQSYAPEIFLGKPLLTVDLTFKQEAKWNDTLSIHTAVTGENAYTMYGCFPDGHRCFEAAVTVAV